MTNDGRGADGELATEVQAFWEMARGRAKLGRMDVVLGASVSSTVQPPAWSFGDNPALADELLGLVLDGRKRATATAMAELETTGEPRPVPGDLSILLDGAGHPRALIRTTDVDVVPFDEVTEEFAALEAEGDGSLAFWREGHERYFRRVLAVTEAAVGPDLLVVCERFELLYPKDQDR